MRNSLSILRAVIFWGVLAGLLASAAVKQFTFSLKPLYLARNNVAAMIQMNDVQKLQTVDADLFSLVQAINAFPASTRFYFVPDFKDSGNTGLWWWHIYLLARYLSYPRLIFCQDKVQYDNSKEIYLSRFIGQARTWQDLDWISSRHIQIIILMRNNTIEFIRAADPIQNL